MLKTAMLLLALSTPAKAPDYTPVPKVEKVGRICTQRCTHTCPPNAPSCADSVQCTTTCF